MFGTLSKLFVLPDLQDFNTAVSAEVLEELNDLLLGQPEVVAAVPREAQLAEGLQQG